MRGVAVGSTLLPLSHKRFYHGNVPREMSGCSLTQGGGLSGNSLTEGSVLYKVVHYWGIVMGKIFGWCYGGSLTLGWLGGDG